MKSTLVVSSGGQKVYPMFQKSTGKGAVVAQSVERVTSGEEVMGSIPAVATRSPLVGPMSV